MYVSNYMTHYPISISPNETCERALAVMAGANVDHLPVLEGSRLVGIVTERDIRRRAPHAVPRPKAEDGREQLLRHVKVAGVMTYAPVTIAPGSSLTEAAALMGKGGFRALPVLHDHKLVGILTMRDVLAALIDRLKVSAQPNA